MKREILFKAKRVDNGEWVKGKSLIQGVIEGREFAQIEHSDFDNYRQYEVEHETVCQFTGLLDKNGNKIFEGDKLSDKVFVYVVEWNKQNTAFCLKPIEKIETKDLDIIDYILYQNLGNGYLNRRDLEIIGNIHD